MEFDPTKKYSAWINPDKADWDRTKHMERTIPLEYRDRVEMIDKPGVTGWVYRPKEAIEAT